MLRSVEGMSYLDIEKGIEALGVKAREGELFATVVSRGVGDLHIVVTASRRSCCAALNRFDSRSWVLGLARSVMFLVTVTKFW